MSPKTDPCAFCQEIAGELKDVATWLADGELSAEQFANTVLTFERRKLQRFGFSLSSAISPGPIVHFSLRFAATGELCASMDVDPATGAVEMQPACG